MPANSINFTINADASKGEANIKRFGATANDVSKGIQEAFGKKLTQVISFAAIEEATRRTAEWALEITQTSKALGVTAEQLQTLEIIASKTGTAQGGAVDMFKNITSAAEAAIGGNAEMIQSFQALGVHIDRTSKIGDVFGQVMNRIASLPGGLVNNPNNLIRNASAKITGSPENVVQTFAQGYAATAGGPGLGDKAAAMSGKDIASDADIQALASVWSQILTSLKESGKQLLPLATLLLAIVKTVIDALGGAVDIITAGGKAIVNVVTGDWGKALEAVKNLGRLVLNMFVGLGKAITTILDIIPNILGKIPGLRGHIPKDLFTRGFDETAPALNRMTGTSEGQASRGQALGQLLPTLLSFGEDAVTFGANKAALTAAKMGFKDSGFAKWARKVGSKQAARQQKYMDDVMTGAKNAQRDYLAQNHIEVHGNVPSRILPNGQLEFLSEDELNTLRQGVQDVHAKYLKEHLEEAAVKTKALITSGRLVNAGIAGVNTAAASTTISRNTLPPGTESTLLPPLNPTLSSLGGGSANVRIGGMFGAGEAKIIRMTQKMIELLGVIATNTGGGAWYGSPAGRLGAAGGGNVPQAGGN